MRVRVRDRVRDRDRVRVKEGLTRRCECGWGGARVRGGLISEAGELGTREAWGPERHGKLRGMGSCG